MLSWEADRTPSRSASQSINRGSIFRSAYRIFGGTNETLIVCCIGSAAHLRAHIRAIDNLDKNGRCTFNGAEVMHTPDDNYVVVSGKSSTTFLSATEALLHALVHPGPSGTVLFLKTEDGSSFLSTP